MLALKSGTMAGDEVHKALVERDFSAERFAEYGRFIRQGVENMRRLVYAFYNPKFSFRTLTNKYPERRRDGHRLPERRCQQGFLRAMAADRGIRARARRPSGGRTVACRRSRAGVTQECVP